MRCGEEEMKHCRKKRENGQVWGWGGENQSGAMSQAGYCSSVSPGAVCLLRNMFWGWEDTTVPLAQTVSSCWDRPFTEGTAVPKVSQSGFAEHQQPWQQSSKTPGLHKQFSFPVFREAGDLMTERQIYRMWRREMWKVLDRFIFKKQCNIQKEMSRKELDIQDWRANLWMICKSSN